MKIVVVYESMFGNTRAIAEAIAEGFDIEANTLVVGVGDAHSRTIDHADLVVVGGPTHAWRMSTPRTRQGALDSVRKSGGDLALEEGADTGPGVREWLTSVGRVDARAAAFDTRIKAPQTLTGRASRGIERQLLRHGLTVVTEPLSFLVNRKSHLLPGEQDRARLWGSHLAAMIEPVESSRSASRKARGR